MKTVSKIIIGFTTLLLMTSCGGEEESDYSKALSLTDEQTQSLADYFNGTSDEKASRAADVAATNLQTSLLIAILGIATLILIAVLVKNKNKK